MKLTDGKRTVDIEMAEWDGNGWTPDWSNDFFEAGTLKYNEEKDAYIVPNVDYCIEQANDWKNADGDFSGDRDYCSEEDLENRCVCVEEIK